MYIGPWQEYRLAKLQNEAIDKIQKDLREKLQHHLTLSELERFRELLGSPKKKKKDGKSSRGIPKRSLSAPINAVPGAIDRRNSIDRQVKSSESHVRDMSKASCSYSVDPDSVVKVQEKKIRSTKLLKKKTGHKDLTGLEAVKNRKKMYAAWIKERNNTLEVTVTDNLNAKPMESTDLMNANTLQLPLLLSTPQQPKKEKMDLDCMFLNSACKDDQYIHASSRTVLPPIYKRIDSNLEDIHSIQLPGAAGDHLEDSFNDDDVNDLLKWTEMLPPPE